MAAAALLSACSSTGPLQSRDGAPPGRIDPASIPNAVPRVEPRSAHGNPSSYVVMGHRYHVRASAHGFVQRGIASWYGTKFHGRRTASGERYDMYAMTAAHKTLPIPTYVRVTNLRNGRWVIVKVNDRGPFHADRIIDLSYAAAAKLHMLRTGTAPVEVRAIDPRAPHRPATVVADNRGAPARSRHGGSTLFLQVGAFAERSNAERLRGRLLNASLPGIHISKGYHHQRPIYRVQVGPLDSVEQAEHMEHTLLRYGVHDAAVIVD